MLCVERMRGGGRGYPLPTISEYEPRCPPTIVVELCSNNCNSNNNTSSNQEVSVGQDVPDCASVRYSTVNRIVQWNNLENSDKREENSNSVGSSKVSCLQQDAQQIINQLQQRKSSGGNPGDIRNKTISASWEPSSKTVYKTDKIKDSQRDMRNTRINPNSSALPRITNSPEQNMNNSDIRNKTIKTSSHSDGNTVRNFKPSSEITHGMNGRILTISEPWREVLTVRISDQVRIWTKDSKNLVVKTSPNEISKLDCDDENETGNKSSKTQKAKTSEQLVAIPDGISLDSLIATLSLEGQLIIKEIRQQKPSKGNIVVIPIEKM